MNAEEIQTLFVEYRQRYFEWQKWDERLLDAKTYAEWMDVLRERAANVHEIYCLNLVQFQRFLDNLQQNVQMMPADLQDDVVRWIREMYVENWGDPFLLRHLCQALLPIYEARQDPDRLVLLNLCMGYACLEISRTGAEEIGRESTVYYGRVIEAHKDFDRFADPASRVWVMVAFINMILVESCAGNASVEDSYQNWLLLKELRAQEKYCRYDREQPRIAELAEASIDSFCIYGYSNAKLHLTSTSNEMEKTVEAMNEQFFQEELARTGDVLQCADGTVMNHCSILFMRGDQYRAEAFELLRRYYDNACAQKSKSMDEIAFYTNTTAELIYMANNIGLSDEERFRISRHYIAVMRDFVRGFKCWRDSYTMSDAIQKFVFDYEVMEAIETKREKLDCVFQMVISRHMTTLLHSLMVAAYVKLLATCVLDEQPQLFVGFRQMGHVDDVRDNREQLLQFLEEAAILHDVGKSALSDVINTQYRRIGDTEFDVIRTHPAKGAEYLACDRDFWDYCDVAYGHHKYYNGEGGYPDEFDNRASPDRIAIDMIALCDCLDAATDSLGRSYRAAKSFDQVLEEFRAGAGTRYNPDLVELMLTDAPLQAALRELTDTGREAIYHEAFDRYVAQKDE